MRGCDDNSLFQEYSSSDIILIDDKNKCENLGNQPFSHQAVIVGWGTHTIYQYALVKQSWGNQFGYEGYQKI